jgi:hypothetical protein
MKLLCCCDVFVRLWGFRMHCCEVVILLYALLWSFDVSVIFLWGCDASEWSSIKLWCCHDVVVRFWCFHMLCYEVAMFPWVDVIVSGCCRECILPLVDVVFNYYIMGMMLWGLLGFEWFSIEWSMQVNSKVLCVWISWIGDILLSWCWVEKNGVFIQ